MTDNCAKLNKMVHSPVLWLVFAVLFSQAAAYGLRVFYSLDARGIPPLWISAGALASVLLLAAAFAIVSRFCKSLPAQGAACMIIAGMIFCFANPPMQAPDEYGHFLRSYSISCGHFDFVKDRNYPEDVNRLYNSFPGAWVSAHTSQGLTRDEAGNEITFNSSGYALKQWGENGRVSSPVDSFTQYFSGEPAPAVEEPILFMVLPFLPQALGMFLARLMGLGALGCLYGGRILNLLAYAAVCYGTLRQTEQNRGVLLAFMLQPLSLYMAASLSYDALLLACYYLCASCVGAQHFSGRRAAAFGIAFVWMNIAKPYINLLWLFALVCIPGKEWQVRIKNRPVHRWQFAGILFVSAMAVSAFTEWYGRAFRSGYGVIGRMLSEDVVPAEQLMFVLKNPLRFAAVLAGTFYENDLFLGQLGVFGALDLPISFLNCTAPAVLLAGIILCAPEKQKPLMPYAGGVLLALVYAASAAGAMYITYTPVGMVRIIGLQARYFLPAYLLAAFLLSHGAGKLLKPAAEEEMRVSKVLLFAAGYAAVGGLLLFVHYFLGPVYLIK